MAELVFYTVTSGLPELKAAVVDYFAKYYGYEIQSNQVIVATGAKFSLYTFFMSVIDPGDEVIIRRLIGLAMPIRS